MTEGQQNKKPSIDETKLNQIYQDASAEKKFSEEELEQVKEIQKAYLGVQADFGQIAVARMRLTQQLQSLDEAEEILTRKFEETQEVENKLINDITDKYGVGTLNPDTGAFTPSEEQVQSNVDDQMKNYDSKVKKSQSPISDALDEAVKEGKINQK